ncbi:hypothetical protein BDP27DRAFT_1434637 [Rhodocollybia butyracea]|uniref:F-box domain-containing protein n=1 Tax=Rhodocollybia butyracea TaxID=206335 RepID=A0A9P5P2G6_9AGAR|nr:hypothetical protein BDP27DRAFT_1434637 [Rhodocollybia butyracea]
MSKIENDLRSEYGPFVKPPKRVKEILALADKDIEDYDSEITRLREQLTIIEAQKEQLGTQRAKLRALLSPMRKMPNEILFRILRQVCEENVIQHGLYQRWDGKDDVLTSSATTYLPAVAVSSVCSRWRELTLSSSSFWENLTVEIHSLDGDMDELSFMVTRYLERSGERPLRLSFHFDHEDELSLDFDREEEFPFLNLFLQHAHRWESLACWADHSLSFYRMLSQLHFPSLLELDIRHFADPDSNALDIFEHAPRLRILATTDAPPSKTPFNQLETLHFCKSLRVASPTELANTLRNCHSLKKLLLLFDVEVQDPMAQGTWKNITWLNMMEPFEQHLKMVFLSFSFPSLTELIVESEFHKTTWPVESFGSFVTTSSCMITAFTLRGISISDLDLIAALRVMPSISYLKIDDINDIDSAQRTITSHLISSLRHQSTSFLLAPKLHSLHLISVRKSKVLFDDATFIGMVESRWFKPGSDLSAAMFSMGKACIRSVVLTFSWREVDAEVYQPLRNLDAEGLRVVVAGTNGVQV